MDGIFLCSVCRSLSRGYTYLNAYICEEISQRDTVTKVKTEVNTSLYTGYFSSQRGMQQIWLNANVLIYKVRIVI